MLLAVSALASLAGCTKQPEKGTATANGSAAASRATAAAGSSDPIASAESAAPAAIARNASVASMDASGNMEQLRKGTNGWTCVPDSPATPGPDPMCADANATKWVAAWTGHRPPPTGTVGLMYMLEGGTDASNVDPYATRPTASNDWVKTGPHVMVVGSSEILAGHPSGGSPDTTGAYVMWSGTPYAHLMVPVAR